MRCKRSGERPASSPGGFRSAILMPGILDPFEIKYSLLGREVAGILQQREVAAQILIQDNPEAVHRGDGWIKRRVVPVGEVIHVQDRQLVFGVAIRTAVIALDDNQRGAGALCQDGWDDLQQLTVEVVYLIRIGFQKRAA